MAKTDEDFISVDPDRLDREWVRQPRLAFVYGEKLAEAKHEYDQAKNAAELAWAEVSLNVRACPSEYGLEKVTDAVVESATTASDKYQGAARALLAAKKEMDYLTAAANALEHKKKALEKLVELAAMHYHSEPKASSEDGRAFRDKVESKAAFRPQKRRTASSESTEKLE